MIRTTIALLATVLLTAGAPTRAADDEVLSVRFDELPKVWTRVAGRDEAELDFPAKYRAGCARFSFIVEADGRTSSFKLLGTFPNFEFGDGARDMVEGWRFEPTTLNAERLPAYTEHTVVFVAPGADRVIGSNRREKISPSAVALQCMLDSARATE
jgi:hypothetical protein